MNFPYNPNQRGVSSDMPSTGRCWMFILPWLRLMAPNVEIGERYLLWKPGQRGHGLFLSRLSIHTSGSTACCDITKARAAARPRGDRSPGGKGRYKNSPDLAKPLRAAEVDCNNALCRFSINMAKTLWRLISVDTAFGSLPRRTSTRTLDKDCSKQLLYPTITNLM